MKCREDGGRSAGSQKRKIAVTSEAADLFDHVQVPVGQGGRLQLEVVEL